MKIYNITSLPHEQLISAKTGETFSRSAILTELLSFQNLFIHHEILAPGKRASSPHRHTIQEELIFVLSGFPTAHLGNQALKLKPGDFIGFLPESQALHFIENATDEEVSFLVISSGEKDDEVI